MSNIQFKVPIPAVPGEIQVYNTTPAAAPVDFISRKLSAANLPALIPKTALLVARTAGGASNTAGGASNEVHAVVNQTTGETHLVPSLAKLTLAGIPQSQHKLLAAQTVGHAALDDATFIAKDATTLHPAAGVQLLGTQSGGPAKAEPKVILTLVPATRQAGGLRVYGAGSQALVAVDNQNSVVGALRRWHTASPGQTIKPMITVAQV